jgi:hypothetical protein
VPPPRPVVTKDHVGAFEQLDEPLGVLERGLAADVGIRSGAEALRQLGADLHLHGRAARPESLHVRVDGDEIDAREPGLRSCG